MQNIFLTLILKKADNHDYDVLDHRSLVYETGCEIRKNENLPEESALFTEEGMEEFVYSMTENRLYAKKIACLYSIFHKDNEAFQDLFIKYTKEALEIS